MTVNDFIHYPESQGRARQLGKDFYYTGKPCKRGHLELRYTSSGNCKKCIEEKREVVFQRKRGRLYKRCPSNQYLAEQASKQGKSTYESISECPKGHRERYTTTNNCVECDKEARFKRKEGAKWKRVGNIYGLKKEDFYNLIEAQEYKCKICQDELNEKNTHIDHCHKTGLVRSLLCSRCNQAIGLMREDISILKKAIWYLENA